MKWNWIDVTETMMRYPSRVLEQEDGTLYMGWKFGDRYAVQRTRKLEDGTLVNERTDSTIEWDEIESANYTEIDYRKN